MKRPHFTLRDLFWLTLVVALALGWWVSFQQAEASWKEKWVEHVMKAGFAQRAMRDAQSHAVQMEMELKRLKDHIEWLETPEDERPPVCKLIP